MSNKQENERKPKNWNGRCEYEYFDVAFSIMQFAALKYPNTFTRREVFESVDCDVKIRTQQRILQTLSLKGYLIKGDNQPNAKRGSDDFSYFINTRAVLPFMALSATIKHEQTKSA